jgi:hypothetical protein
MGNVFEFTLIQNNPIHVNCQLLLYCICMSYCLTAVSHGARLESVLKS